MNDMQQELKTRKGNPLFCSIKGCGKKYKSKGFCKSHYRKLWLYGDPNFMHPRASNSKSYGERFWDYVEKTDYCWNWTGNTSWSGYGQFTYKSKPWAAHRYSWFLAAGKDSELNILHSCDNRRCVNPAHLREGSRSDNAKDVLLRDRFVRKLCFNDVRQIKLLIKQGLKPVDIAKDFNVSKATIERIRAGSIWKI